MAETEKTSPSTAEKQQDQLQEFFGMVFRAIAESTEELTDELAEFNKRTKESRRRINAGARRTDGRIV